MAVNGEVAPIIIRHDPSKHRPVRGLAEVKNLLSKIILDSLGSELVPAFLRNRAFRMLGANMDRTACIWSGCNLRSTNFRLGRNVFINHGFFFDGVALLIVEDHVRMGQFVRVITGSHAIGPSTQRCNIDVIAEPVIIERGCWIGTGALILPGVTVARGCVIAAGSVVRHSTMPDGLYGGVPARRLRDLPVDP